MESISTFLQMGGYAAFVWPAFAVTAVVLAGLLVASLSTLSARERLLRALEAGGRGRRQAAPRPAEGPARADGRPQSGEAEVP
ncbi:MAG: heme exporter protein CcmD [Kiloniellales bacterium]